MKKKLLITGGSGLLGINWAFIARDNFEVILGLHSRVISMEGVKTALISIDSVENLYLDIIKIQPDIIINAAANTNLEDCEENFSVAKKINTDAARNIAIVCEDLKIKLVHISSDHLFSGKSKFVDELSIPAPINNYAITKCQAEVQVNENNPTSLIIRTNFFGWGTNYRSSLSDFILQKLRGNIDVYLSQDIFFTPILIDYLIFSIDQLLKLNKSGIYNIVSDERLSKYEFGLKIADCFDLNVSLIKSITHNDQINSIQKPKDMSLSNNKLTKVIGNKIPNLNDQLSILKKQEKHRHNTFLINER